MIMDRSGEVLGAMEQHPAFGGLPEGVPPGDPLAAPMSAPGDLEMITPDVIEAASMALASAGLIAGPVRELGPDMMSAITALAEQIAPGIYDLSNPDQLLEFLNGIANGTIPLPGISAAGPVQPGIPGI